jgi:hypothetical protein
LESNLYSFRRGAASGRRVTSSIFTNGFIPDVTVTNEGADQIAEGIALDKVPRAMRVKASNFTMS